MSITKNTRVSRKRSFSSSTTTAIVENNAKASSSSSSSSTTTSIDTTVVTNNETLGKKKKLIDDKVEYYTTTTTRSRRQVVTDQSSTTTTTTNVGKVPRRSSSQRSTPAFLHKLYNMVNDISTTQFIRWSKEGNSFLVENHEKFAELVLPRFYKHNTFASFVRQLNMYDFHKIPHIQQGVLIMANATENELWEFSNPNFKRDRPDLLVSIARKRNRDRNHVAELSNMNLASVVKEISAIKKHQTNITADLKKLRKANEIIWKETLAARENHLKHQQVISKILHFLTAVFSNDFSQLNDVMMSAIDPNTTTTTTTTTTTMDQQGYLYSDKSNNNNNNSNPVVGNSSNFNSSDSVSTSESNNSMDEDYEINSSDNEIVGETNQDKLSPKMTNNTELRDIQLPFTQTDMKEDYNINFFSNKLGQVSSSDADSTTPSAFNNTSFLNHHQGNQLTNNSNHCRSAQAITHDIEELQGDVETLVVQLGIDPSQFSEHSNNNHFEDIPTNYSNMISSASKNDRLRLFELADDHQSPQSSSPQVHTPQVRTPQVRTPQVHTPFVPSNNQPILSSSPPPPPSRQNTFHPINTHPKQQQQQQHQHQQQQQQQQQQQTTASASHSSDTNPLANFFCHLLKSVDPYHQDPPFSCARGTAAMSNEQKQSGYSNNMTCPTPKIETPSQPQPSPHHQHQQPTDPYKNGHANMFTTTIPASKAATHHHPKPAYAADNYHGQADQLFRSAVLIQERMQSNKYHSLQLPRDPSASNQLNQSSSHPTHHHHPYYPSTSLPSHHHHYQADFTQNTVNNPITPSYQPSHHSFHHSQHFQ